MFKIRLAIGSAIAKTGMARCSIGSVARTRQAVIVAEALPLVCGIPYTSSWRLGKKPELSQSMLRFCLGEPVGLGIWYTSRTKLLRETGVFAQ
jgi:hypothetical protein